MRFVCTFPGAAWADSLSPVKGKFFFLAFRQKRGNIFPLYLLLLNCLQLKIYFMSRRHMLGVHVLVSCSLLHILLYLTSREASFWSPFVSSSASTVF